MTIIGPPRPEELEGGGVDDFTGTHHARARHDLVVEVRLELGPVHDDEAEEVGHVAGVEEAGVRRHRRGRVGEPAHEDAVVVDVLARLRQLAVAARVGRHVDDDRALRHPLHHGGSHKQGRLAPGHGGRRDHHVGRSHLVSNELALLGEELLGLLAGIAPGSFLGFEAELDERCAQRLHLFFGSGAHVVRPDLGTEAPGRGDGLQARNAGTEDEHLGGRDRSGRGHEQREELGQSIGGRQRGEIARHRRL